MFILEGSLLLNRILWLGIAFRALALTLFRFRFAYHMSGRRWWRRGLDCRDLDAAADISDGRSTGTSPISVPSTFQTFHPLTRIRQVLAVFSESLQLILVGWGGFILLFLALILIATAPGWMRHMGIPLLPTTGRIMSFLGNSQDLLWVVVPLIIAFYSGELIWREWDAGMSEITDATPVPEWVLMAGKFLGVAIMLVILQVLLMIVSIFIQFNMDYYQYEIGLYLQVLFGIQLIDYLLFPTLVFAVHVVVNHKYMGHMVSLGAFGYMAFGADLGIHNLLTYGSDPGWTYSDLRGFGHYLTPLLWFKMYWVAWALLLGMIAKLFWGRGKEQGYWQRLQLARRRFTRFVTWAAMAATGLILISADQPILCLLIRSWVITLTFWSNHFSRVIL